MYPWFKVAPWKLLLVLVVGGAVALRGQGTAAPTPAASAVFTIVFEVTASSSDGTSASSKVQVQFAPGLVWQGHFGFKSDAGDERTPAKLYKLRGGLAGLRPDEPMCFGILKHSGTASAGGRTLSGPGSIQMEGDGVSWSLREDAARFTRTEKGGVLYCTPIVYLDEDPPEFGLLTLGAYDFGPGDVIWEALRTFQFSNEDLKDLTKVSITNHASLTSTDGSVHQSFKCTLTGAVPEEETEATVTVEDYDGWIPRGNLDQPDQPGDLPLKVTVKIHKKGEPSVPRQANLKVSLPYVSKNRGVCGNWPQNAEAAEGLRFRQEDFQEKDGLRYEDRTHLSTDILVEKVTFNVQAYDFGAWGTLRVSGTDDLGRPIKVRVRGKDTPDLDMPKDENGNRIADAWETAWAGGLRRDAGEDQDAEPKGDRCSGDALSLYEEYRGFRITGSDGQYASASPSEMVTGSHVRTDPRVKDVFICDQLGYGIGFFRQSGLCVHLVKPEECGVTKTGAFNRHTINPNRGEASLSEQYVLWLLPGAGALEPDDEGGANMKPGWGPPGPPRDCEGVYVNLAVAQGGAPFDPSKKVKNTITHELAHGCRVKHHGEQKVNVVKVEYLVDHVDDAGKKHPKGSIETGNWSLGLLAKPGTGASFSSGDTHCYMTYKLNFIESATAPPFALWDAAGRRFTGLFYKCASGECVQTQFCDDESGWHIGLAGPPDDKRGHCLRQFCVNHLKH